MPKHFSSLIVAWADVAPISMNAFRRCVAYNWRVAIINATKSMINCECVAMCSGEFSKFGAFINQYSELPLRCQILWFWERNCFVWSKGQEYWFSKPGLQKSNWWCELQKKVILRRFSFAEEKWKKKLILYDDWLRHLGITIESTWKRDYIFRQMLTYTANVSLATAFCSCSVLFSNQFLLCEFKCEKCVWKTYATVAIYVLYIVLWTMRCRNQFCVS